MQKHRENSKITMKMNPVLVLAMIVNHMVTLIMRKKKKI